MTHLKIEIQCFLFLDPMIQCIVCSQLHAPHRCDGKCQSCQGQVCNTCMYRSTSVVVSSVASSVASSSSCCPRCASASLEWVTNPIACASSGLASPANHVLEKLQSIQTSASLPFPESVFVGLDACVSSVGMPAFVRFLAGLHYPVPPVALKSLATRMTGYILSARPDVDALQCLETLVQLPGIEGLVFEPELNVVSIDLVKAWCSRLPFSRLLLIRTLFDIHDFIFTGTRGHVSLLRDTLPGILEQHHPPTVSRIFRQLNESKEHCRKHARDLVVAFYRRTMAFLMHDEHAGDRQHQNREIFRSIANFYSEPWAELERRLGMIQAGFVALRDRRDGERMSTLLFVMDAVLVKAVDTRRWRWDVFGMWRAASDASDASETPCAPLPSFVFQCAIFQGPKQDADEDGTRDMTWAVQQSGAVLPPVATDARPKKRGRPSEIDQLDRQTHGPSVYMTCV